jgi:hypothetical protein
MAGVKIWRGRAGGKGVGVGVGLGAALTAGFGAAGFLRLPCASAATSQARLPAAANVTAKTILRPNLCLWNICVTLFYERYGPVRRA